MSRDPPDALRSSKCRRVRRFLGTSNCLGICTEAFDSFEYQTIVSLIWHMGNSVRSNEAMPSMNVGCRGGINP